MQGIKDHLGLHAQALMLRSRRNDILASNIANAATPNFKARDLDFQAELNKRIPQGPLDATTPQHIRRAQDPRPDQLDYRMPTMPTRDGNTVEMAVEQMQFSENVIRYNTSLTFINRKVSGLMSAIKGE